MLRVGVRSLLLRSAIAQALGFDADRYFVADVWQVFVHAEVRALERCGGGKSRDVMQRVRIDAGAIEDDVQIERMTDATQAQRTVDDAAMIAGFFDRGRNEMRRRIFAGFEEFPRTYLRIPRRIAQIQRSRVDDGLDL
jgi:hypothetical protein